ncbi:unnamed protein product, partial [Discosporangium mesarthrocarpum]
SKKDLRHHKIAMASGPELRRENSDGDVDDPAPAGGPMRELLASYYGMQKGPDRSLDVDSANFDSEAYVRGLLKKEKLEGLLRKDEEMVREVKKLDSDMQMLVYENYNKFISATDTIRKMARNVEGMEKEMADLGVSMDRISEGSERVNASLAGNRSKLDKLVRVRRLLERLDFLFQLPQKLEEAVQDGEYAKTIRYFSMTKDILRKHSHVSSFGAIQRECEETVRRLQQRLQGELDSPDVSRDTLVGHAELLLALGVDPSGLKRRFLEVHERLLRGFLAASRGALVADCSVSLDACLGKLAEGFLPMLLRMVEMYRQLFNDCLGKQAPGEEENNSSEIGAGAGAGGGRGEVSPKGGGDSEADLVEQVMESVDGFFSLLNAKVESSTEVLGGARGKHVGATGRKALEGGEPGTGAGAGA